VNPLRSIGARLSLALVVVVAGALAAVYAIVVPSLERNLVNAKLSQLRKAAPGLARAVPSDPIGVEWPDFLETASASTNARVAVFDTVPTSPPAVRLIQDSHGLNSQDLAEDPIALRSAVQFGPAQGVVTRGERRFAEVAVQVVPVGTTMLLSADLHDSLGNVHLVQRRLLIAGLLALVASLLVGHGAASVFARRVRRLEQAAERIAAGRFDEPVIDTRRDELGQLARAFERMRQRLAQLDDARREFIANASHELRTPLFSLGGFIELLTDEELDEETRREFLETMREQVERLTKLATDLLDLSRLDAHRLHVEAEPVDLADLAPALADEFRAVAHAAGHPLEIATDGEAVALADWERTFQIGRTLVENALRHTPPGTRVQISAVARGRRAALVVEVVGPGVPADQTGHGFDRFYPLDGTMASGSGLGLAIARELAELMGGRIELESEPGRTVFTLLLPAATAVPDLSPRERVRA
jgi:two-component system OmpR family sensor kinase